MFMRHFHKNEEEKKKILSEVAQGLNKEQYNNDTVLKEYRRLLVKNLKMLVQ